MTDQAATRAPAETASAPPSSAPGAPAAAAGPDVGAERFAERFIPFRRRDVVTMCLLESGLSETEQASFRRLAHQLSGLIHHAFHSRLEHLKDCYAPVNPDLDTRAIRSLDAAATADLQRDLVTGLREVIEAANFEPVTDADLDLAMREESLFKVRLHVDFEDFEEVLFFRRGESERTETLVEWFGLRRRELTFTKYDRVVLYVRFRDAAWFEARGRELPVEPGSVMVKLFQNVPRADLEMLFPNTEVRMKTIDKLLIGVPAAVSGAVVVFTKLGTTLVLLWALLAFWAGWRAHDVELDQTALVALVAGLGALGGYLWKQFSSFTNRKMRFMKALADNLYFRNLDNNAGVFHRLVDAAEEEEVKETLLGYFFLWRTGHPMTAEELDRSIEAWFRQAWGVTLDFEISDALRKLRDLRLVEEVDGRYSAVPMELALAALDTAWDHHLGRPAEPADATPDPA